MRLDNDQYNTLMREYEEAQLESRHIYEERYAEIEKVIPEYQKLDNEIVDISMAHARAMLFDSAPSTNSDELNKKLSVLAEKKRRLLEIHGYSRDYLSPVYKCADCKDTGYIDGQKCHCFKQKIVNLLYEQSNISDVLKKENFATYDIGLFDNGKKDPITGYTAREMAEVTLNTAKEYVKNFGSTYENLLLAGSTGLGKTFLSHCIANEILKKGFTVIYLTAPELFDKYKKNMFEKDAGPIDYIEECDLLIIDDLGSECSTSVTISTLNICLNQRLINNKATIISSNLTLQELKEMYGERNFSRIIGSFRMLHFYGTDLRVKGK